MRGYAWILGGALFWGLSEFFSKLAVASIGPWTASLVRSFVWFPIIVGYVAWRAEDGLSLARFDGWTYAVGSGLCIGGGILFQRLALVVYDVSLVSPFRRINVLVTVLVSAVVLGEVLTLRKSLGVVAALVAVFMLSPS